jgi:hypothetical protein
MKLVKRKERISPMRRLEREKGRHFWGIFWIWIIFPPLLASSSMAQEQEKGILWVNRFSNGANEAGIPVGWVPEKTPGSSSKIAVEGEKGNHFLCLLSVGDSFGLRKDISFDIRKYPYLSWRWKVSKLPQGGDIQKRDTDDEAGQIYVLFPRFPAFLNTLSVGYIWDSQAPVGLSGTSTAYSKMRYTVLQSGSAKLNQWISETRNVYEDFKKLFQVEPPTAGGVLLYINSQHTKSSAECFYGNIFFSANPPNSSGK